MNNLKLVEMIRNYEGKTLLEQAVINDVKQRINDWLSYSHASVNDDYINKQIQYFQSCMDVLKN